MDDPFSVKGKVAIVTGGRRGIGRAIAWGLYQAGAKVTILAKSDYDRNDMPDEVDYFQCKLQYPGHRENVIDTLCALDHRIDILINNAGCQHLVPALDYSMDDWNYDMEVMVNAAFDLSRQAAKIMIPNGGGKIVNISSISGVRGVRGAVSYSVAKHALIGLTRSLSNEWAAHGICVNAILPGFIETDMLEPLTRDAAHTKEIVTCIPVGRLGKPDDLVGTVLWLCSSASDYVTGALIPVDGGWLSR